MRSVSAAFLSRLGVPKVTYDVRYTRWANPVNNCHKRASELTPKGHASKRRDCGRAGVRAYLHVLSPVRREKGDDKTPLLDPEMIIQRSVEGVV